MKFSERYEQIVYRVAYRILNNVQQAEDVTQETFIQIYQKIEQVSSFKLMRSEPSMSVISLMKTN
ncbi:RNA polymerase sigma factor [Vagococcus salmoninarum]|uniref:RNA polymerase sigma factor n=1 Tax=Vagococcus salmoninarum TaxID=2739 RepID=UPI003F96ABB6